VIDLFLIFDVPAPIITASIVSATMSTVLYLMTQFAEYFVRNMQYKSDKQFFSWAFYFFLSIFMFMIVVICSILVVVLKK
jgi:hypothetical protein